MFPSAAFNVVVSDGANSTSGSIPPPVTPANDAGPQMGSPDTREKVFCWALGKELEPTVGLINFQTGENGWTNFRDHTAFRKHTAVKLPETLSTANMVDVGVYVNHEQAVGLTHEWKRCIEPMDRLNDEYIGQLDAHLTMALKHPLPTNHVWAVPQTLEDLTIHLQKRNWTLSKYFKKLCRVRWPKFIIMARAIMPDGTKRVAISPEFEVRSKNQPNKTRAARGLSPLTKKRRRTPEIAQKETELRLLHADIVGCQDALQKSRSELVDKRTRFAFIQSILGTCSGPMIGRMVSMCEEQCRKSEKWKM